MDEPTSVEHADRVIQRLLADPKRGPRIQQIIADARLFDTLRESPGWQRLFQMVEGQRGKWMNEMSRRFMNRPKKEWPTSEEISYHRGFYEGARFVLMHPAVAEENLEAAAEMAWRLYGGEDNLTEVSD